MTSAEPDPQDPQDDSPQADVPAASPAYSTPPPEGIPDAENPQPR